MRVSVFSRLLSNPLNVTPPARVDGSLNYSHSPTNFRMYEHGSHVALHKHFMGVTHRGTSYAINLVQAAPEGESGCEILMETG